MFLLFVRKLSEVVIPLSPIILTRNLPTHDLLLLLLIPGIQHWVLVLYSITFRYSKSIRRTGLFVTVVFFEFGVDSPFFFGGFLLGGVGHLSGRCLSLSLEFTGTSPSRTVNLSLMCFHNFTLMFFSRCLGASSGMVPCCVCNIHLSSTVQSIQHPQSFCSRVPVGRSMQPNMI